LQHLSGDNAEPASDSSPDVAELGESFGVVPGVSLCDALKCERVLSGVRSLALELPPSGAVLRPQSDFAVEKWSKSVGPRNADEWARVREALTTVRRMVSAPYYGDGITFFSTAYASPAERHKAFCEVTSVTRE
jgi:hypothetical protein